MEEHAIAIIALLVAKVGGAVLGGSVLGPAQHISKSNGSTLTVYTYLNTLSPFTEPSTAAMQVAASSFLANVT